MCKFSHRTLKNGHVQSQHVLISKWETHDLCVANGYRTHEMNSTWIEQG